MKKLLVIFSSLLLIVCLCSCKSENAKVVDTLILSIGEVNLKSEKAISDAEAAYNSLSDKEKSQIENYEILENAKNAYQKLERENLVYSMFNEIETSFVNGRMQAAENICNTMLATPELELTNDEINSINNYLNKISLACFAGSHVVMPDIICGVPFKKVVGDDSIGRLLDGKHMYVSYRFDNELSLTTAFKRYKEYLNANFEYITSDANGNYTYEEYYYLDSNNNQISVGILNFASINIDDYEMSISMANGMFDLTKLNTDNPALTIRDHSEVLVLK